MNGPRSQSNFTKFRLAIAKTRDGVADTKILFVGDSITEGNGSTLFATFPTYGAFPSRVTIGSSLIQAKPNLGLYGGGADNRFTLAAGWAGYSGGYGFGTASAFFGTVDSDTLVYSAGTRTAPTTPAVYYYRYGAEAGWLL